MVMYGATRIVGNGSRRARSIGRGISTSGPTLVVNQTGERGIVNWTNSNVGQFDQINVGRGGGVGRWTMPSTGQDLPGPDTAGAGDPWCGAILLQAQC